jgi:hypothetical protein
VLTKKKNDVIIVNGSKEAERKLGFKSVLDKLLKLGDWR